MWKDAWVSLCRSRARDRCISACRTRTVDVALLSDGVVGFRKPRGSTVHGGERTDIEGRCHMDLVDVLELQEMEPAPENGDLPQSLSSTTC